MPLYDFACMHKHTTEALRGSEVYQISCSTCGRKATRQFSSRVAIIGPTTDTRGMFRRYQEASAELDHSATKYESLNDATAPSLGLWQQSREQAKAMTAAGESPIPKSAL